VLAERAILDKFVEGPWGRRYVEFQQGDWETFRTGHSHPEGWHRSQIVNRTGGIIVNRWNLTGERLHSYIRPHEPVRLYGRSRPSKYIYPSGVRAPGQAKRLEVHPLVRERLLQNQGEPLYLCIEGCLKADAVAGTGRISVSVPSVTMWDVDGGLDRWLPVLRAAPVVYVVPDSDYNARRIGYGTDEAPVFVNGGEVRYFTDRCVMFYRRTHQVNMHYCVPPYLSSDEARRRGVDEDRRWKVGIDDHIAFGGNFDAWNPRTNPSGLHQFEYERGPYRRLTTASRDYRTDLRDQQFIAWLESSCGSVGLFSMSDALRDLGWHRDTVLQAKRSCVRRGILQVWDGRPLGPGQGNSPHVFRFIRENDGGAQEPAREAA
jgi:hypothetical protein